MNIPDENTDDGVATCARDVDQTAEQANEATEQCPEDLSVGEDAGSKAADTVSSRERDETEHFNAENVMSLSRVAWEDENQKQWFKIYWRELQWTMRPSTICGLELDAQEDLRKQFADFEREMGSASGDWLLGKAQELTEFYSVKLRERISRDEDRDLERYFRKKVHSEMKAMFDGRRRTLLLGKITAYPEEVLPVPENELKGDALENAISRLNGYGSRFGYPIEKLEDSFEEGESDYSPAISDAKIVATRKYADPLAGFDEWSIDAPVEYLEAAYLRRKAVFLEMTAAMRTCFEVKGNAVVVLNLIDESPDSISELCLDDAAVRDTRFMGEAIERDEGFAASSQSARQPQSLRICPTQMESKSGTYAGALVLSPDGKKCREMPVLFSTGTSNSFVSAHLADRMHKLGLLRKRAKTKPRKLLRTNSPGYEVVNSLVSFYLYFGTDTLMLVNAVVAKTCQSVVIGGTTMRTYGVDVNFSHPPRLSMRKPFVTWIEPSPIPIALGENTLNRHEVESWPLLNSPASAMKYALRLESTFDAKTVNWPDFSPASRISPSRISKEGMQKLIRLGLREV